MAMSTTQYAPKLPLEVWTKILENLEEGDRSLLTFWTVYRQVCTAFRDAVDLIFVAKHLPETLLDFEVNPTWDVDHGKVNMTTLFNFKDISEDRKVATFQGGEEEEDDLRELQEDMIGDAIDAATVEKPVPYVQFRGQVHDTEVPGLEFDSGNLEVTFNWRGMYSAFFAEERRYEKIKEAWVDSKRSRIEDMKAKVDRGEFDMANDMEEADTLDASEMENIWRAARRARMKQQYFEKHGSHWDPSDIDRLAEKRILKRLKFLRSVVSKKYSDKGEDVGKHSDEEEDVEENEMSDELMDEDADGDEDEDEGEDETVDEDED